MFSTIWGDHTRPLILRKNSVFKISEPSAFKLEYHLNVVTFAKTVKNGSKVAIFYAKTSNFKAKLKSRRWQHAAEQRANKHT